MRYVKSLKPRLESVARLNARILIARTLLDIVNTLIDDVAYMSKSSGVSREILHRLTERVNHIYDSLGAFIVREDYFIQSYCDALCVERIRNDEGCLEKCYNDGYSVYGDAFMDEVRKLSSMISSQLGNNRLIKKYLREVESRRIKIASIGISADLGIDKTMMLKVLSVIKELIKSERCAERSKILSKASEIGIDEKTLEKVLDAMIREYVLFEIRESCYVLLV